MSNIFSKFLKDRSGNRPIRMGNQLEHGGVIAQTESLAVVDEPITFTSTVDFTDATVVGLPFYTTEISAIDAGLAFGDKYVDSDGVIQTVTKIKQTITLAAGVQTMFGFLIDLDSLDSKALLDVLPTYTGALTTFYNNLTLTYSTGIGGNLTEFTNGRGYVAVPSVAFSYSIYGPPLSSGYHQDLTNGNNVVVHNAETTTSASATSWIGVSFSAVITLVGGVQTLNPTTWTKGQAYLLSGVGSTQAAIGSPSTSIPLDITGEQVVDLLTAENYDPRPYKVYTATLTQTGTNVPVAVVLENTLGGTVVWSRLGGPTYRATLVGAFTTGKTYVESKTLQDDSGMPSRITVAVNPDHVTITNMAGLELSDSWPGALVDNRYQIEIRVYK